MRRRVESWGPALMVALALSGCGSDDGGASGPEADPTPSSTTPTSEPPSGPASASPGESSPRQAVERWLRAYTEDDSATACALQTDRYTQDQIAKSVQDGSLKQGASCEDSVELAHQLAGALGIDVSQATITDVKQQGGSATVTATLSGDEQTYTLVRSGAGWQIDDES